MSTPIRNTSTSTMSTARLIRRMLALCFLMSMLLLSACVGTVAPPRPTAVVPTNTVLPTETSVLPTATTTILTPEDILKHVRLSVVLVNVTTPQGSGNGSGFAFAKKGNSTFILTNAHVAAGATSITVTPAGATAALPARVQAISHCDDIAILEVDNADTLTPVTFASNAEMQAGAKVYAVGFPMNNTIGGSEPNIVDGTISQSQTTFEQFPNLILSSVPIVGGYSGSPLVNADGDVIGMNTFGIGEHTSLNYAIGSDYTQRISKQLREDGNLQWLGLNFQNTVNANGDSFVQVSAVDVGSPAAAIGMLTDDIILSIDGQNISSEADICRILRSRSNGNQLNITIARKVENTPIFGQATITVGQAGQTDQLVWEGHGSEARPDIDAEINEEDAAFAYEQIQQMPSAKVLFNETFDASTSNIEIAENEYGSAAIQNEQFVAQASKAGWGFFHYAVDSFGQRELNGDFVVAVDMSFSPTKDQAEATAGAGIMLGNSYTGEGTWRSFEVALYDNGTWQLRTFRDTGWYRRYSMEAVPSAAIHTDGTPNRLILIHSKDMLFVIINKQFVGIIANDPPVTGHFALSVERTTHEPAGSVVMDNVEVLVVP